MCVQWHVFHLLIRTYFRQLEKVELIAFKPIIFIYLVIDLSKLQSRDPIRSNRRLGKAKIIFNL